MPHLIRIRTICRVRSESRLKMISKSKGRSWSKLVTIFAQLWSPWLTAKFWRRNSLWTPLCTICIKWIRKPSKSSSNWSRVRKSRPRQVYLDLRSPTEPVKEWVPIIWSMTRLIHQAKLKTNGKRKEKLVKIMTVPVRRDQRVRWKKRRKVRHWSTRNCAKEKRITRQIWRQKGRKMGVKSRNWKIWSEKIRLETMWKTFTRPPCRSKWPTPTQSNFSMTWCSHSILITLRTRGSSEAVTITTKISKWILILRKDR